MSEAAWTPRLATVDDAAEIARLLHDFNTEFDTPTPGVDVLAHRLGHLLGDGTTFAMLAGSPALAVGVVTLRPNVWYDGQVALLDELYVEPHLRGKGIGTAMIELLVRTCRVRGVGYGNTSLVPPNRTRFQTNQARAIDAPLFLGFSYQPGA